MGVVLVTNAIPPRSKVGNAVAIIIIIVIIIRHQQ
jgi:hypothetical protein